LAEIVKLSRLLLLVLGLECGHQSFGTGYLYPQLQRTRSKILLAPDSAKQTPSLLRLAEKAKGMPRENRNTAFSPQGRRLSVKEASIYTGLSFSTLNKLRCSGQGPRFAKIGRRVVYDVADLASWLAKHLKRSTSDP
jgi:predicted DNA-binding transcriptional regulator AlpA